MVASKIVKGIGITWAVSAALGIIIISLSGPKGPSAEELEAERVRTEELAVPWLAQHRAACEAYKTAPNDIARSAIYSENKPKLTGMTMDQPLKGTLDSIFTSHGGKSASAKIMVGSLEFVDGQILRGSTAYQGLSTLQEGQCVVFRARECTPSSVLEKTIMCDGDYSMHLIDVAPCVDDEEDDEA